MLVNVSATNEYSIEANSTATVDISVNVPSGYTVAAIKRATTGNVNINIQGFVADSTTSLVLRNFSSSTVTGTVRVIVLCIKS